MLYEKIKTVIKTNKLFFISLAILFVLISLYFAINSVLNFFNLQFTNYATYTVFFVCVFLIIIIFLYWIVFFFKKTHKSRLCWRGCMLILCCLFAFLFCLDIVFKFGYRPIHIVEYNKKKYIANVTIYFSERYVEYYDYKNMLVSGKSCRIIEHYSDGTDDPIVENDDVLRAYYYNEDGTYSRSYEKPGL